MKSIALINTSFYWSGASDLFLCLAFIIYVLWQFNFLRTCLLSCTFLFVTSNSILFYNYWFIYFVYGGGGKVKHVSWYIWCRRQSTAGSRPVVLFTMLDPGVELRSLGLAASTFTYQAITLALSPPILIKHSFVFAFFFTSKISMYVQTYSYLSLEYSFETAKAIILELHGFYLFMDSFLSPLWHNGEVICTTQSNDLVSFIILFQYINWKLFLKKQNPHSKKIPSINHPPPQMNWLSYYPFPLPPAQMEKVPVCLSMRIRSAV